jgi:hypothetical protein
MIVREQHISLQEIGGAFRERLVTAQKASIFFDGINRCSRFIVGFAGSVGVSAENILMAEFE